MREFDSKDARVGNPTINREVLLFSLVAMGGRRGDMPRYMMPLLQSGVMRPCGASARHMKSGWIRSLLRWLGFCRGGRVSHLPSGR